MKHIEKLTIQSFRGLRNAKFQDLGQINLLVGGNNSGKTTVLEAIEMLASPSDLGHYAYISRMRDSSAISPKRLPIYESLKWLFPIDLEAMNDKSKKMTRDGIEVLWTMYGLACELNISYKEKVIIKSDLENEEIDPTINESYEQLVLPEISQDEMQVVELNIEVKKENDVYKKKFVVSEDARFFELKKDIIPTIKTYSVTPIDHRINRYSFFNIIMSDERLMVIDALKLFDENIEWFEDMSPQRGSAIPYVRHKQLGPMPVSMFGDGLRKAITLAAAVVRCENGVLLIDEIETAIHTKVLGGLFSWLVRACKKFKVQLFATTHSLETIDALIDASRDVLDNIVAYKLEAKEDKTKVKRFSGHDLYDIRYELGRDVR